MKLHQLAKLMQDAPSTAVLDQFIDVVLNGEELSEQNPNALYELSSWLDDAVGYGVIDDDGTRAAINEHLAALELRGWRYGA